MKVKAIALILIVLLLSVAAGSAATTVIGVTQKNLTIVSGQGGANFYGIITTNNTTVNTMVTGETASLSKTLALLNSIKIGQNIVTESNGVISAIVG